MGAVDPPVAALAIIGYVASRLQREFGNIESLAAKSNKGRTV